MKLTPFFLTITMVMTFWMGSIAYPDNYALLFDGKDDHVSCGMKNLPLKNEPRTLEAWFKTTSPDGYQQIVGYGTAGTVNSALALFTKGDAIVITQWGASIAIPAGINDGKWHHAAVTHDGQNTQTVYVDGEAVGNWDQSLNTIATTSIIGACLNSGEQFFDGIIDEVRIWDVERTKKEIQDNMHKASTGKEPHLVSYWKFDEGKGTIAHDSTASQNDGELLNGPKWVESDVPVEPSSIDAVGKLATTWGKIKGTE